MKAILSLLLLLVTPAVSQEPGSKQEPEKAPSLAELARQSREKRFRSEKEIRTITNADLERMKGARVSSSLKPEKQIGEEPSEAPEAQGEGIAESEQTTAELDQLKQAFAEARLDLKNALNNTLVLELKMNNLRNAFFREDDGTTQARVQAELDESFRQLEAARKEVERAKEALQKLQKEARELGLTPGAIRELTGEIPEPASILSDTTPTP